ncbi:hypothetical protein T265_08703 [Opisthorchis viverrini]|uniref:Uncharacterized protein n=1 Tax=Opisthorchis viverrini TaxID=6198 RepID=A0A075A7E4_OPIVI|nr:hypothetical protein T265_08703 [Opisthorchis viverrini]KER23374.1 hypothetical protein T265_08703 [Opisthorchis viverrini]
MHRFMDSPVAVLKGAAERKDTHLRGSWIWRSAVASFRCLTTMPPEGSTRAEILPGCPSLDRGSRVAEVGFEPRTLRSVNSRSNHLGHFAPIDPKSQTDVGSRIISLSLEDRLSDRHLVKWVRQTLASIVVHSKSEEPVSTDTSVLGIRGQTGPLSWQVSKVTESHIQSTHSAHASQPIGHTSNQPLKSHARLMVERRTDTHTRELSDTPKQLLHLGYWRRLC